MNVYESIPTMEKGEIRLRPVMAADEAALLRVYGDPLALPFFNSDNCHGDIFYYDTPEKMRRAMDFWRTLMTKAAPYAVARTSALETCGFVRSETPVMGHHGERFEHYWVREK